jgi:CheY-like chemotaxis protein
MPPTERPTAPPTVPPTVLVVDDDQGLQETLEAMLSLEGYRVVVASDGQEALDKLGDGQADGGLPRAILLDVVMPRMDGYAFAEELERRGLRSRLPIVLLTADARAEEKAARVRAEAYVEKPFEIDELLEKVALLVGR